MHLDYGITVAGANEFVYATQLCVFKPRTAEQNDDEACWKLREKERTCFLFCGLFVMF